MQTKREFEAFGNQMKICCMSKMYKRIETKSNEKCNNDIIALVIMIKEYFFFFFLNKVN